MYIAATAPPLAVRVANGGGAVKSGGHVNGGVYVNAGGYAASRVVAMSTAARRLSSGEGWLLKIHRDVCHLPVRS